MYHVLDDILQLLRASLISKVFIDNIRYAMRNGKNILVPRNIILRATLYLLAVRVTFFVNKHSMKREWDAAFWGSAVSNLCEGTLYSTYTFYELTKNIPRYIEKDREYIFKLTHVYTVWCAASYRK